MSQSRQLAAIMFTDIVGYTTLMGEDEEKAFELLEKNRLVQRPIIEEHNGRWLKEIGDGVLASFTTVSDAVYCAKAIQEACLQEDELKLRIGIHQGEVVFKGEDVFGDGVNIASRLEPLAPVGGILVSESVHRNLGNKKNIVSTFLREVQLKNVKEPIKIYSVLVEGVEPVIADELSDAPKRVSQKVRNLRKMAFAVAGVLIILLLSYFLYSNFSTQQVLTDTPPEITDKSIAVLPFKNDSPDADNQYFADGMMDEVLNHLQRISELGVKSRTAVEPYRNSTLSFGAIAQELDVAFVLEGAVRKYGERFRVTTQLIEVESGNHLWSDTYDGIFSDTIFVVQSNIAKQIASSLHAVITPEELENIDKISTTEIAAYDLYTRGNHEYWKFLRLRDDDYSKTALDLFKRALQIDPDYLQAIVGIGQIFNASNNSDSAMIYANRAIDIDPNFNRSYGLKGYCYQFMGKPDLALEYFFKAISLPPKDEFWLWYHAAIGQHFILDKDDPVKAIPYLRKALEMTEGQFLSGTYGFLAACYSRIGDYEKTEQYLKESMNLGQFCVAFWQYNRLLLAQGKFREALDFAESHCSQVECERICALTLYNASILLGEFEASKIYFDQFHKHEANYWFKDDLMDHQVGYVYFQLGKTKEAEKIFNEQILKLQASIDDGIAVSRGGLEYILLARMHAFQGNKKEAFRYLTAYSNRGFNWGWDEFILIDPFFESLREDSEFKSIVQQAQEEKAALRAQVREMEQRGELDL